MTDWSRLLLPLHHPDAEPPRAEITQTGRFTYDVTILHGMCQYGPNGGGWVVFGSRRHAERKARRELAKYQRRLQRERDRWEITE